MIVFSDTTPIIALSSIDQLDLLPTLFNEIHVVEEVVEECAEGGKIIVPNLTQLDWVNIVKSEEEKWQNPFLKELDKGEKHTRNMALHKNADHVSFFYERELLWPSKSVSPNNYTIKHGVQRLPLWASPSATIFTFNPLPPISCL